MKRWRKISASWTCCFSWCRSGSVCFGKYSSISVPKKIALLTWSKRLSFGKLYLKNSTSFNTNSMYFFLNLEWKNRASIYTNEKFDKSKILIQGKFWIIREVKRQRDRKNTFTKGILYSSIEIISEFVRKCGWEYSTIRIKFGYSHINWVA